MSLENCHWTNTPIFSHYLQDMAYSDDQEKNGTEHLKNAARIKSVDPWQQVFEFKRLMSNNFKPYENDTYYADLIFEKTNSTNNALALPFYDYLMSLP